MVLAKAAPRGFVLDELVRFIVGFIAIDGNPPPFAKNFILKDDSLNSHCHAT